MHFLIFGWGPSSILFFSAAMERALSSQTISLFKLNLGLEFCAICAAHAMSVVVCVQFPWLYFAFMFNWEVLALQERERERESTQTRLLEGCVLWREVMTRLVVLCVFNSIVFHCKRRVEWVKEGLLEWELFRCESHGVFWCWSHVSQF